MLRNHRVGRQKAGGGLSESPSASLLLPSESDHCSGSSVVGGSTTCMDLIRKLDGVFSLDAKVT